MDTMYIIKVKIECCRIDGVEFKSLYQTGLVNGYSKKQAEEECLKNIESRIQKEEGISYDCKIISTKRVSYHFVISK